LKLQRGSGYTVVELSIVGGKKGTTVFKEGEVIDVRHAGINVGERRKKLPNLQGKRDSPKIRIVL